MTQNQHQVSIIGSPRSRMKQFALENTDTCPGHVSRSYSSSSHVSSHAPNFSGQERTSPEGRSVGDLEQDSDKVIGARGIYTRYNTLANEQASTIEHGSSTFLLKVSFSSALFSSLKHYMICSAFFRAGILSLGSCWSKSL